MRFLQLKAFWALFMFDIRRLGKNFAKLHMKVLSSKVADRRVPPEIIPRVCAVVNRACIWYPKSVLCLQRSAVTTLLLRNCGVSAQMVLGAQRIPFRAHAWVEVNGQPINERIDVHQIFGVWERC